MDIPSFRIHAHKLVDWMSDYLEGIGQSRVQPDVSPGDLRRALPPKAPDMGEPFDNIFKDFNDLIIPGMTNWQHPGWFAYFPANYSPASILGEMLAATMAAQCMSWETSPAATELEEVVMNWLRQMLNLPDTFHGVIQDTASTSTLVALLSARERVTNYAFGREGTLSTEGQPLMVYSTANAHASILKGVKIAGYGMKNLRRIPVDSARAMRPECLREAIQRDQGMGYRPACVIGTIGTTSSGAIDPIYEIADICQEYKLWLHVDAAWAGSAAICPEYRPLFKGIEKADSFLFNPHKWMLTNFDCTAYFVRDTEVLQKTLDISADYLKTRFDEEVTNFRNWQIQLGRRFRALKLWFVIRSYGVEGLQSHIRRHVTLVGEFAKWIDDHPDFEKMAPVSLALVCFRCRPHDKDLNEDELNKFNTQLLDLINRSGEIYMTHTILEGRYTLRFSSGQLFTKDTHVHQAWKIIKECAETLQSNST